MSRHEANIHDDNNEKEVIHITRGFKNQDMKYMTSE